MSEPTSRLGPVTLRTIAVSAMSNNVYLLTHTSTGAQVLIDAADDALAILRLIDEGAADITSGVPSQLALIFTTHSHWDHVRALGMVKEATLAPAACGAADDAAMPVPMDFTVVDGQVLPFDGFELVAVGLRGHTPGSTALALAVPGEPVQLFTGDSLFPGGVGKTANPASFTSLYDDVVVRVFDAYPDDTVVWPGHGLPTTLGAERPHLAEWRARGW